MRGVVWNCLEPVYGSKSSPNTFLNTESTCVGQEEVHRLNSMFYIKFTISGVALNVNKI